MPADRPPEVVLLTPALDAGVSAAPEPHTPEAHSSKAHSAEAPSGVSAGAAGSTPVDARVDTLAEAVTSGTFERTATEARPWELRLMSALGLLSSEEPAERALASIPFARLLGEADLADHEATAAGDIRTAITEGRLVVADPVSLQPGRDEATLTPPEALSLSTSQADALIASANELLANDDIAMLRGTSGRWYLAGMSADGLDTPPTHFLAQREIGRHLPGSAEAAPWRRLMTELQMLWHAHPVNVEREARGALPITGAWFWGGGPIPAAPAHDTPLPTVATEDPLSLALARHAGAPVLEVNTRGSADTEEAEEAGDVFLLAAGSVFNAVLAGTETESLIIVDPSVYDAWLGDDPSALARAREHCQQQLLQPAAQAVIEQRAASLVVVGGDGGQATYAVARRAGGVGGMSTLGSLWARVIDKLRSTLGMGKSSA